jgi:hypothetical protein
VTVRQRCCKLLGRFDVLAARREFDRYDFVSRKLLSELLDRKRV